MRLGLVSGALCGGGCRAEDALIVFRAENSNTHRHMTEFTGALLSLALVLWATLTIRDQASTSR